MSELILCKGKKPEYSNCGIVPVEPDDFHRRIAFKIWDTDKDIWTVRINGKDIDIYLTGAQDEMQRGVAFENTAFYEIINELLDSGVKIAMWYDIYYEDLPLCKNSTEVLAACYDGIMDVSGMCEVYFRTD